MKYRKIICALILASVTLSIICPFSTHAAKRKNTAQKTSSLIIKLQAQKGIPAGTNVVLHGQIDMLSYACKEVGITLSAANLPAKVKSVITGSPAYFANIKIADKIVGTNFKDNKFCLSIDRAGTPYYTEIRLSSLSDSSPVKVIPTSPPGSNSGLQAMGFRYVPTTGEVTYVDPKSDLFGKVRIGDIFVSLSETTNGMTTFGYPTFRQNNTLRCYPCREKPVDTFAPDMAAIFHRNGIGPIPVRH